MRAALFASALTAAVCGSVQAPGRVVIFGDSLAVSLAASVPGPVVNAGVPGERVASALVDTDANLRSGEARISEVLATGPVDTLVLMAGANDILEGVYQGGDASRWLSQIEAAMAAVVQSAKSARVRRIVLATVPPQRVGGARRRDAMARYVPEVNLRYARVAKHYDVELVDVFALVSADLPRLLAPDDVHLTEAGNAAVRAAIWK